MIIARLSYSDSDGQHSSVLDRDLVSIGRADDQDIVLSDPLVSRRHAEISRDGSRWTITDQKSTHGTFLNSSRIESAVLKSGDVLQFGSLTMQKLRFEVESPDAPTRRGEHDSIHEFLTSIHQDRQMVAGASPTREIEQLNWLIAAARQINEGVMIDDILSALVRLTIELTGVERGYVFLWKDGKLNFAQGLDSSGNVLAEDQTVSRHAIEEAIQSGTKFSLSDTASDELAAGWSSVIVNEIRSIYCIPLRQRNTPGGLSHLLGLLYLDSRIKPGSLSEIDHRLLDTLSTETAALLHNILLAEAEQKARQAREELAIAARIHSGLMSIAMPVLPYAVIQARSIPCLAIGGDFYDAVVLEDCVCVTLVDVSGKGVSAAIVAAIIQGIIHAQLVARQSLADIAFGLNEFLYTRNVGKYATMVMLRLFPDGRVEYLNCGHLMPLVIHGKAIRRLEAGNQVVGLLPEAAFVSSVDVLQPGERVLLATDGVTEAENGDGRQFEEVWLSAVTHCRNIGEILEQVASFQAPQPAQDDCTLVEVRYGRPE